MKDVKTLKVWEKSHALALAVYRATGGFPQDERFGLVTQMRRACVSVPTSIAEGCGRGGDAELAQFLQIAMGSASELEYQLLLARDLGYLEETAHAPPAAEVAEVKQMLTAFIKRLKADR